MTPSRGRQRAASSSTRAASRACRAGSGEPAIAAVAIAPFARIASWSASGPGRPAAETSSRRHSSSAALFALAMSATAWFPRPARRRC
ncbi:hypothetical protein BTZ20_0218 [Rhodococcus sp. MTM3W5.2]|nr:hypothetical protein BTZ20_0218 [Rhodococcus sp. MTM3W5.2]